MILFIGLLTRHHTRSVQLHRRQHSVSGFGCNGTCGQDYQPVFCDCGRFFYTREHEARPSTTDNQYIAWCSNLPHTNLASIMSYYQSVVRSTCSRILELLNNPKHAHSRESTGRSTHLSPRSGFRSFRMSPLGMLEVDHLLRFVVYAKTELPQFVAHVAPGAADADGGAWQHK